MSKIGRRCFLFANGQVGVFTPDGKQIPELQTSLLSLWAERAASLGYDPEGVVFETVVGMGWRIVKREDGSWGFTGVEGFKE